MSNYHYILSHDYHIHTHLSACARDEMTIENIVRRAERIGYTELGISDHLSNYLKPEDLRETKAEIEQVDSSVRIGLGCEMNVTLDGEPLYSQDEVDFLDYVMVALGHVQGELPSPEDAPMEWLHGYVQRFERLIECGQPVDVIAHPLRTLRGFHEGKPLMSHLPIDDWRGLFAGLRDRGIAIELNDACENWQSILDDVRAVYSVAKEAGLKFVASSDAHGLDRLGFQILWTRLADDLGLTPEDWWRPSL